MFQAVAYPCQMKATELLLVQPEIMEMEIALAMFVYMNGMVSNGTKSGKILTEKGQMPIQDEAYRFLQVEM